MKPCIVQVAAATGNQDYTNAQISNDLKGGLLFASGATANNTSAAQTRFTMGMFDTTDARAMGGGANDAVTTTAVGGNRGANTLFAVAGNGSTVLQSTFGSILSNGYRNNVGTAAAAYLTQALMLAGSDVTTNVVTQTLNTGTSPVTTTVSHGGSSAPDAIVAFSYQGTTRWSMGFWERSGGQYASTSYCNLSGQAGTVALGGEVSDNCLLRQVNNSASQYTITVTNVDADSVDLVQTGTIEADIIELWFLWISGAPIKVGVLASPTTLTTASITGMSASPNVGMFLPSKIATLNSFDGGDGAGCFGFGAAADNNGSLQQYCSVISSDDAAATTDENSYTANAKCIAALSNTGAIDLEGELQSWNSDGVTINFTNVLATVCQIPYMLIAARDSGIPDPDSGRQHTVIDLRTITGITAANPAVVTYVPNNQVLVTDQLVRFYGITGTMSAINQTGNFTVGNKSYYQITVTDATHFSVNGLDTTGLSYTSGGVVSAGFSVLEGANPAAADGDVLDFPLESSGGYDVIVRPDGGFTIDSGTDDTRQVLQDVKFWDVSAGAYSDDPGLDIYVNNTFPVFNGTDSFFHTRNVAISAINLSTRYIDPDSGDAIVITAIDAPGNGYSFSTPNITGTPNTNGVFAYTFRWTDQAGDFFEHDMTFTVSDIVVGDSMVFNFGRILSKSMTRSLSGPRR